MKKLSLNKETLRSLEHVETEKVDGAGFSIGAICRPSVVMCPITLRGCLSIRCF
jgi:hypothetical protein